MIYETVTGNGNNASFKIIGFVGITVVDYQFSGSDKHIVIQPAIVMDRTAIPSDDTTTTYNVHFPPTLLK